MKDHGIKALIGTLLWLTACLTVSGQTQKPPAQNPNQDPQKTDTIKISSIYVNVPVIATDRYGRLVTGLSKDAFVVQEDGKTQSVQDFSASEAQFSVVLLLDTSRSTVRKLAAIQKAAETFIKQLQPRDRVMVLTFDDRINVVSDFTGDVSALKKAVKSARTGYSTRLYDAIQFAITDKLAQVQGRKAIVVLTDGVDTASKEASFESTVDLIAGSGIICYAIQYETRNEGAPVLRPNYIPNGIPFVSNFSRGFVSVDEMTQQPALRDRYLTATDFLRTITHVSGARHLRADSVENTSFAFQIIATELRNLYTLGYYSSNDQRDGNYRAITVSTGADGLSIRTRSGYRAPKGDSDANDQPPKPATPKRP
jgi:VWFA-related protein